MFSNCWLSIKGKLFFLASAFSVKISDKRLENKCVFYLLLLIVLGQYCVLSIEKIYIQILFLQTEMQTCCDNTVYEVFY